MRGVFGYVVALLVLTAMSMATAASAQTIDVVPGQSIGSFQIGEDVATVFTSLGPLHSQDDLPGGVLRGYYWPLKRIGVIADKASNKVVALAISYDEAYKTDKGVAAGTEMETIRSAYGQEETVDSHSDDDTLVYDKLGVAFVVDKAGALGGRVSVIFVFSQGHYKDVFAP